MTNTIHFVLLYHKFSEKNLVFCHIDAQDIDYQCVKSDGGVEVLSLSLKMPPILEVSMSAVNFPLHFE